MADNGLPRRAWLAGLVGPLLFVAVFSIEGALRPGYDALAMFVSELSLGERGWVQIGNFVVFGLLFFGFALAVRRDFTARGLPRTGPVLLLILALSYLCSGPFVTDPGTIFTAQKSWHGTVHGVFGAIVFTLMPISVLVFARRFLSIGWRGFGWWTLLLGLAILADVAVLTLATKVPALSEAFAGYSGLIQRGAIIPFMLWLVTLALKLRATPVQGATA